MFCWFYTAEYSKLVKKGINFFYLMHAFRHVLLLFFGVAVSQDPISPGTSYQEGLIAWHVNVYVHC